MTRTLDRILLLMAVACCCLLAGAGEGPTREELRSAASSTEWVLPNHSYASQRPRTGAPGIRATISITRAAASPHLRLRCLPMSCVTIPNAVARTDL
jgi:hypothetical protein